MKRRTFRLPAICAHRDCARQISQRKFACTQHWFALPEELRHRLSSAAVALTVAPQRARIDALHAVHAEAIESWKGVPA